MKIILFILFLGTFWVDISIAQYINSPTELEAENEYYSSVRVRWRDNSSNEEGFYIERALVLNDSAWETVGRVPQNERRFYDYWITPHRKYFYRTYAYNGNARSYYSNIDSVLTLGDTTHIPAAPTNLRVIKTTLNSIAISWDDNAHNEEGFIIARRKEGELLFQFIDSVGTDILTYQEVGLTPDNLYYYKVCSYNDYGISDYSNTVSGFTRKNTHIIKNNGIRPNNFFLGNNFPNPFNPVTTIKFGVTSSSSVSLKIYNSLGKEVHNLLEHALTPGIYEINWNAENFSSGIYFYKIETEGFMEIKKMILVK